MYCINCGKEIVEDAVFCPYCGCKQVYENKDKNNDNNKSFIVDKKISNVSVKSVAKVFMTLSCICFIFYALIFYLLLGAYSFISFIPLVWTIPMTIHYYKMTSMNKPVGLAFKICSLIFVNLIAGILMLCDTSDN